MAVVVDAAAVPGCFDVFILVSIGFGVYFSCIAGVDKKGSAVGKVFLFMGRDFPVYGEGVPVIEEKRWNLSCFFCCWAMDCGGELSVNRATLVVSRG